MKELSPEKRALLAGLLSLLIIIIWTTIYKPPPPAQPPAPPTAPPQPAPQAVSPAPAPAPTAPPAAPKTAAEEKTIVVENGLYRVEFSNRGAIVRSWQLKKYTDDHKPPRTLDLVHPEAARQTGGWPFSLVLDDPELEGKVNSALYTTPAGGSLQAPTELQFEWSDGRLEVSKHLKFDISYMVHIETSVRLDGKPLAHGLAWRGGFGDTTVFAPIDKIRAFFSVNGKLKTLPHDKLGVESQPAQRLRQADRIDYAGIEDQYFAAAFLPVQPQPALAFWHWKLERDVQSEGKTVKEPVAEAAVGSVSPGPLALRAYVGPKDLDELKRITPPLTALIEFGWFEVVALPLFYLLKWLHGYVHNYGWAIIVLTILINMVLFPLKVKSWRSMQKMQKVAPEIKAIQERYKKYSLRDPRKQQMNQEVMAVYKREGINPMGGCLPMLLQMPIWIALYSMLNVSIELRHAPWVGWIRNLSSHDPYYILPVLMTVTMYLMQKMTPMTTADPMQQKMFTLMPLFFGLLFFRMSSGLVLYILASNLVAMAQQWYLNRTTPVEVKSVRGKKK